MEYTIGSIVQLSATFTDIVGTPTDPTTAVLEIQLPNGSVVTKTGGQLAHPSTGVYTYNLPVTFAGIYKLIWTGTGTIAASFQSTITGANSILTPSGQPNAIDLCTLDAVKSWLTIPSTVTTSDVLLSVLITQASLYIMNRTGVGVTPAGGVPMTSPFTSLVALSEWYDGTGTSRQFVRTPPINTVSAVIISGTAVPAYSTPNSWGYVVDDGGASIALIGGGVFRGASVYPGGAWSGGGFSGGPFFAPGVHNVNIQYTAGYAVTPYDLSQACVELVGYTARKRNWIGQRSQALPAGGGTVSYVTWEVPPMVEMVIRSYTRMALV